MSVVYALLSECIMNGYEVSMHCVLAWPHYVTQRYVAAVGLAT